MPSVVFTLTTSVRPPLQLTDFVDGLADNPPKVAVNASSDGDLTIDYHSSSTLANPGEGDIDTWTEPVVGGPQIVPVILDGHEGTSGYLHYSLAKGALRSNRPVSQQITVPTAWSPADLFRNGRKGGFWDVAPDTTFTDTDMEVAAGVDDAICILADLSGNGNNKAMLTLANRPLLKSSGGLYYYQTSDNNDHLKSTISFDATDELTLFCLYDLTTSTGGTVFGINEVPYAFRLGNDGIGNPFTAGYTVGGVNRQATATPTIETSPVCHIGEFKISTSHIKTYANGQSQSQSSSFGAGSNFGTDLDIYAPYFNGMPIRVYAMLIIDALLDPADIINLQNWAKTRGNISW
jgi:hypothetical protein